MASSAGAKRPHSPEETQPTDFLPPSSDRDLLVKALTNETSVRFTKLQNRDDILGVSKTLQSDDLLQVYPELPGKKSSSFSTVLERDRHSFERKCRDSLKRVKRSDDSLTPVEIIGHDRDPRYLGHEKKKGAIPVPPNLLYFEILLEAYMGYSLQGLYNVDDPTLPRAAVAGGAVLAALAAWRDPAVAAVLQRFDIKMLVMGKDVNLYLTAKEELTHDIHNYFLNVGSDTSPFATGDVDVFLQPSPHTRALFGMMTNFGLPSDVLDRVSDFVGGCGIVGEDLDRFSKKAMAQLERSLSGDSDDNNYPVGEFVYALTDRGLSFIFAKKDDYDDVSDATWPRTSQFIMLNQRADMVGALMDFDLAACSCAYDGINVHITPRAEYALQTLTSAVTPFCLEEKRNRKRIVKYYKRGFNPVVVDPNCNPSVHHVQCHTSNNVIRRQLSEQEEQQQLLQGGDWASVQFRTDDRFTEIEDLQASSSGKLSYCCCSDPRTPDPHYSLAMFEMTEGHAVKYFANRHNWSVERRDEVALIPSHFRIACRPCRHEYGLTAFLSSESPVEAIDDVLRGEKSLAFSSRYSVPGHLHPSFYGGGVFDSTLVREQARNLFQANMLLRAQSMAEKCRYILRHGNEDGYKQRFIHDNDCNLFVWRYNYINKDLPVLDRVFLRASVHSFPDTNNKAPIGLNPERFIARCESCKQWLHGCEFGTKFCEHCQEQKPAAMD